MLLPVLGLLHRPLLGLLSQMRLLRRPLPARQGQEEEGEAAADGRQAGQSTKSIEVRSMNIKI